MVVTGSLLPAFATESRDTQKPATIGGGGRRGAERGNGEKGRWSSMGLIAVTDGVDLRGFRSAPGHFYPNSSPSWTFYVP
jgi:hypothetical protein